MARYRRRTIPAVTPQELKGKHLRSELSLSEALARARLEPGKHPNDAPARERKVFSSQRPGNRDWDGGLDFPTAMLAASAGLEPTHSFNLSAAKYSRDSEVTSILYNHDVTGEEVDIGRFLSGEPECFLDPQLTTKLGTGPIVELLVSVAASWHVEAAKIERRGAAIFALTDTLEKSGKAVGITICSPATGDNSNGAKLDVRVRVKEPYEHMNTRRLYYFLTHPTVFRRIYFRLWEQLEKPIREMFGIHEYYGTTSDLMSAQIPAHVIYLPSIKRANSDTFAEDTSTQAWLEHLLAQATTGQGEAC